MEFYHILHIIRQPKKQFQFPTGWNSTLNKSKDTISAGSFNSQRDGILPKSTSLTAAGRGRFNSQRDGILQKFENYSLSYVWFQFPTGWNSTIVDGVSEHCQYTFQFPTGWNSTIGSPIGAPYLGSFNSQRDGILHWFEKEDELDLERFNSQRDGILQTLS